MVTMRVVFLAMSILAIKEEQNYLNLNEDIRTIDDQLIHMGRDILTKHGKRVGWGIKFNEGLTLKFKTDA